MVITGRPVGELRRAYQALHEAHEDLKRTQQQLLHSEKMASLGRLVAGVAHELNNPISFVLGNAHALDRYAQRLATYLAAIHAGRPQAELDGLRRELRIDRLLEDLPPSSRAPSRAPSAPGTSWTASSASRPWTATRRTPSTWWR